MIGVIEKATEQLKEVCKKAALNRITVAKMHRMAKEIIECAGKAIPATFRQAAVESLDAYYRREYKRLQRILYGVKIAALYGVIGYFNAKTKREMQSAVNSVQGSDPSAPPPSSGPSPIGGGPAYEIAQPLKRYMRNYMDTVRRFVNELAKSNPTVGVRSLRAVAEIEIRREHNEKMLSSVRASGNKLVWISTHANCSERCRDYQGKLYSLDGTYGEKDGIPYRPLEVATQRYSITKEGKQYLNGTITGFNCRHRLIPYKKGVRPTEIPAKVVEREREVNDKQRQMERRVRELKSLAFGWKGIDDKKSKEYLRKARVAENVYGRFCRENSVARYPDRLRIFPGEKEGVV